MDRDKLTKEVLKEIGFPDGYRVPMPNEENRALMNEIDELIKKNAELFSIGQLLNDQIRIKTERKNNLLKLKVQNQKLINVNRQQYETDQHLLLIAQRKYDTLSRENKMAAEKLNELIEKQSKLEDELAKHDETIKQLKENIEWGEETLLAWNNDLARRNDEVNLLESYHLEDIKRFKELDEQRQHLQRNVTERESILEKEINDLFQVEQELEITSKLICQSQGERSHLLEQWEDTTNLLNSNQRDVENIVEEINRVKEAAREINEKMKEDEQKYRDHLEANEEIELEMNDTVKDNDELKLMIRNKLMENENLQAEVSTHREIINSIGDTLANERTKHKHFQNEITKLKIQLQEKTEDLTKVKEKLAKIKNQSTTTEERLHELDNIYQDQKVTFKRLLSDKEKVRKMTDHVKYETKILLSKIDSMKQQYRTQNSAFNRKESKLRQLTKENKEKLYNLSMQLERINKKIAEVEGTVDSNMMQNLQNKMQVLNEELQQAKNEKPKLEKQLKSLDNESRRMIKEVEKTKAELEALQNRGKELSVLNEKVTKEIQTLKEQNAQHNNEKMLLQLKLEQMMKLTNNECEKVYSLAQQREVLNANINKWKADVVAKSECIDAKKKLLLKEKSSVKRAFDAITQRIEQMRNKYEIILSTMPSSTENDDRSSFSISEHRVRLTQEKLELRNTANQLDERVQKLENDVRLMQNTLRVVIAHNKRFESDVFSVDSASDEYKQKISLEEHFEQVKSMCSQKKKTLKKIKNEIRHLEDEYKTSKEELDKLIYVRDLKKVEFEQRLKEFDEQLVKINRADNQIQFNVKKIEKNCNEAEKRIAFEQIRRDITVKMVKKTNKSVLESLSKMAVRHIELEPTIRQYLLEKELKLPKVSRLLSLNKVKSNSSLVAKSITSNSNWTSSNTENSMTSTYSVVNLECNLPPKSNQISGNFSKKSNEKKSK